jgi:hypothetical protein
MNEAYGEPNDLPFDIIHKRWPIRYRLVEGATKAEIDHQRNHLKGQFVVALRGFIGQEEFEANPFPETPHGLGVPFYFQEGEKLGHCNRLEGEVMMPFRDVLYMRLIPTVAPKRPVAEAGLLNNAHRFGAMGSPGPNIPILNKYGAMCFSPAGATKNVEALTQYFPNGEVWGMNADIMRQGGRWEVKTYLVLPAEDAFTHTLENGLRYMKEVAGVQLPVKVTAGVTGMKGRTVGVTNAVLGAYGKMMTDQVEHTMILKDDTHDAQDRYLFQLFEKIFDQSGHDRPKNLNAFLVKGR